MLKLYKKYKYRMKWVIIKILGFKIFQCVWIDVWCSDVVSFNAACSWYVDGVVYCFELANQHTTLSTHTYYLYRCPRRNVPKFGRMFLMLKYTDITQNTYVKSWTVTEIMAREKCGLLGCPCTVPVSWQHYPRPSLNVVSYYGNSAQARSKLQMYFLLGDKVVHVSAWHSCHV